MLSQKARYSLRAMLYLVVHGSERTITALELAEKQAAPPKFLEFIMAELAKRRLVKSRRGPGGGYLLARPATDIMFSDVIRAVDGPIALVSYPLGVLDDRCKDCTDQKNCFVCDTLSRVQYDTVKILENSSLAEASEFEVGSNAAALLGPAMAHFK